VIPADTPEIGIDQLAAAVRGGAAIVDVREPGGYVAGGRAAAPARRGFSAAGPAPG